MVSPPIRPVPNPSPEVLRELRVCAASFSYGEQDVAAALGLPNLGEFFEQEYSIYRYRALQASPGLALLARLFLINDPVPEREAQRALGAGLVRGLVDGGVLARVDDLVQSRYLLSPVGDGLFFTDRRVGGQRDRVMPVGHDTYNLVHQTQVSPGASVLDLGTGCGVQGILAARWAEQVVCVDVNPRALKLAKVNAQLNDVAGAVVFRQGSLYEPLNGRFDVILANPPFVPRQRTDLLFRDAGPHGEDVLAKVVGGARSHLKDGGLLQVMTEIIHHDEAGALEKIEAWSDGALSGVVFEEDEDFLPSYAREHEYRAAHHDDDHEALAERAERYAAFLAEMGIHRITHATLHLRPDPGEERLLLCPVTYLGSVDRDHVAAGLRHARLLGGARWIHAARDHAPRLHPDLVFSARWSPSSGATTTRLELPATTPWCSAELEPVADRMLRLLAESASVGAWVTTCTKKIKDTPGDLPALLEQCLADAICNGWVSLEPK